MFFVKDVIKLHMKIIEVQSIVCRDSFGARCTGRDEGQQPRTNRIEGPVIGRSIDLVAACSRTVIQASCPRSNTVGSDGARSVWVHTRRHAGGRIRNLGRSWQCNASWKLVFKMEALVRQEYEGLVFDDRKTAGRAKLIQPERSHFRGKPVPRIERVGVPVPECAAVQLVGPTLQTDVDDGPAFYPELHSRIRLNVEFRNSFQRDQSSCRTRDGGLS